VAQTKYDINAGYSHLDWNINWSTKVITVGTSDDLLFGRRCSAPPSVRKQKFQQNYPYLGVVTQSRFWFLGSGVNNRKLRVISSGINRSSPRAFHAATDGYPTAKVMMDTAVAAF